MTSPCGSSTRAPARYVVLHLVVDVRDAMGANAVNTMAEAIAPRVAEIAGGRTLLRILTNKADLRLARARAVFDADSPRRRRGRREHARTPPRFAVADPYRAATHNKGIMNGITAVVLATGNDTRAVEAGAHSHAVTATAATPRCRGSRRTPTATWSARSSCRCRSASSAARPRCIRSPRPASRSRRRAPRPSSADDRPAVGLAQNIAALRALATEGIQRGHMSLHARNVAVTAGARR